MPMNEGYGVLSSGKKKMIKKRPEDMGRGKKVAVAKKTPPAKMTPSYRQEDMGRGKLGGSVSASRQTGGRAKESMPGVRGKGEMMALKGTGKTLRSGTGTGTGYKPNSAAGRGKGGEMMGSNKSSSAQAGKFAPKKKAPVKGSKY